MIFLLYDILLCLSAFILVPYYLLRGLRYGKARRGIRERLGFFAPGFLASIAGRKVIWIHAVSVGETRAAIPLFKALRERYPEAVLLLSNVTETGREVARKIPEADHCIFFPFDLSWVVRKILQAVRPTAIILVETEIWPNFVRVADELDIPVILVNGRISDRSFPRYRVAGKLLEQILSCMTSFCMQTAQDGRRIKILGAAPGRVQVMGNLKFDMADPQIDISTVPELLAHYHLPAGSKVWVAGSTHLGEETILARVYQRLLKKYPDLFLVIVPRHPEKAKLACDELQKLDLKPVLKTNLAEERGMLSHGDILVVDTVGEMLKLYAMADLIFVGGSLVPTGGHNVLEASLMKKPVLYGPYMQNFKEIARLVKKAHAGLQVKDEDDLYRHMLLLLDNPDEGVRIGDNGYNLLVENRGATLKAVDEIARRMDT